MVYRPDDEEDPTAIDCNYNFPQVIFAFILGLTAMFLISVDEIRDFKGCDYQQIEVKQ